MQKHLTSREKAEIIKAAVRMPDAIASFAGISGGASGRRRIPCPIHGGENPNLSYDQNTFHCFTCGASGDVIDFVMQMHRCEFGAAVDLIDGAFGLALGNLDESERQQAQDMAQRRKRESAEAERIRAKQAADYAILCRLRRWLIGQTSPEAAVQLVNCDRLLEGIDERGACYDYDMNATAMAMYQKVRSTNNG